MDIKSNDYSDLSFYIKTLNIDYLFDNEDEFINKIKDNLISYQESLKDNITISLTDIRVDTTIESNSPNVLLETSFNLPISIIKSENEFFIHQIFDINLSNKFSINSVSEENLLVYIGDIDSWFQFNNIIITLLCIVVFIILAGLIFL